MHHYEKKLINNPEDFHRDKLEKRMNEYGFKNINRMEKFLWDLELFQQIQKVLKARVVLKGGAAIQFYLPMEAQRTSVDIDMLFHGTKEEIDILLNTIVSDLNGPDHVFSLIEHKPKNPKTNLPLHTYYLEVPSVLTTQELYRGIEQPIPAQEVKLEFMIQNHPTDHVKKKATDIFAVSSELEYQILPISHLFGDKLTTLGPDTIGVQDDRIDEQVKQFYDIWMLIRHHFDKLDFNDTKEKYLARAKEECHSREMTFDLMQISENVKQQIMRYKKVDCGMDEQLKKAINDFNSLYLNAKVEFNPQIVACVAALIEMAYEELLDGKDFTVVDEAMRVAEILELRHLFGKEKGSKIKELRQTMSQEFCDSACMDQKELKGKRPVRIFWAVVNRNNVFEIKKWVENQLDI